MIDRFGKLDAFTKQFLDIILIKILAAKKNISYISNYNENITITYESGEKLYLKAPSRDDDDILKTVLEFLRSDEK
ncbi:MAG: hypothetical protein GXO31_07065, partial [Epsilonproteobacteria bacterium]|nr:hypothetical protein [Campylobacterota bacterium]